MLPDVRPERTLSHDPKTWHRVFPGVPLVAHLLSGVFTDRWLRIHSLPHSQRYASTEAEYDEILRRQNIALSDVIGSHCVVFVTEPPTELLSHLASVAVTPPTCVEHLPIGTLDPIAFDDDAYWDIYACDVPMTNGCIDFLLRRVADDEIRNTIIVDSTYSRICHPYDGGMDLILADSIEREMYRKRYSTWLSQHPTGM